MKNHITVGQTLEHSLKVGNVLLGKIYTVNFAQHVPSESAPDLVL